MFHMKSQSGKRSGFALTLFFVSGIGAAHGAAMVMKEFGAWSLHQSRDASHNICYVVSTPKSKKPSNANRAAIVFYVSAWPKDGVRNQVSVKFGYPINREKAITAQIGTDSFKLTARDERAYIYDATQELKMLEAMKKGSKMVVKATSQRGTRTTDTYSLSGISAALEALAGQCK